MYETVGNIKIGVHWVLCTTERRKNITFKSIEFAEHQLAITSISYQSKLILSIDSFQEIYSHLQK